MIFVVGFYMEMHDPLKDIRMMDYFWIGWMASNTWTEKNQSPSLGAWNESIKKLEKEGLYWVNQADNIYMMNQSKFHFDADKLVSFERDLSKNRVQIEFRVSVSCKIHETYENGEPQYKRTRERLKEKYTPLIENWMSSWGFECVECTGFVDVMGETYWSNVSHPKYENKVKAHQEKKILKMTLLESDDAEGSQGKASRRL